MIHNYSIRMHRLLNIFLCFVLLGLFLVPEDLAACSSHSKQFSTTEAQCCAKESNDHHAETPCQKECCLDNEGVPTGCDGNCGDKSCQNPSPTFWSLFSVKGTSFIDFHQDKNTCPTYQQPYFSSGFHSIWQPPKIS